MILLNFKTQIKGDSSIQKHENWITCDSCSLGVSRMITSSGGGKSRDTGNPDFQEVNISKSTDMASSDLFFQATSGKSLGKAEIHFLQTSEAGKPPQVYLTIELDDAIVSNYQISSGGDIRPSESFSLNFTKISYQYDDFSGAKKTTGTPKKFDLMAGDTY